MKMGDGSRVRSTAQHLPACRNNKGVLIMGADNFFQRPYRARKTPRIRLMLGWKRMSFACALAGIVALSAPDAHSYEISSNDPCLSHLSSGSPQGSAKNDNRRAAGDAQVAGKAATLGLLLGVRLALGPVEDLDRKDAASGKAQVSALDIARYRTCKKQQALMLSSLY